MREILKKFSQNPYSLSKLEVEKLQEYLGFTKNSKSVSNKLDGIMGKHTIRAVKKMLETKDNSYWENNKPEPKKYLDFSNFKFLTNFEKEKQKIEPNVEPKTQNKNSKSTGSFSIISKNISPISKLTHASKKSLDAKKAYALLDININNAIRKQLGLPQVKENANQYELIDKKFMQALSKKVNPKYSLPTETLNNALLENLYNYDWGNNINLQLANNKQIEEKSDELKHLAWRSGYATYSGKAIDDSSEEQRFVQLHPQYKKIYKSYSEMKNDDSWQNYRKEQGVGHVLTPEEIEWYNTRIQHVPMPGQHRDRTMYDEGAVNGQSAWMGDNTWDLVDAVDAGTVQTAYGRHGTVYPDRTVVGHENIPGYFSNPKVSNYRIGLGEHAIGAIPRAGIIKVSAIQPRGSYADSNRIAVTSPELKYSWDPSKLYEDMLEQAQKENGMVQKARASYDIPFFKHTNIAKKAVSTGGGDIPEQLKALENAGYNKITRSITPTGKVEKFQVYDLNGGGNITLFFDENGQFRNAFDEQDWSHEVLGQNLTLGPNGKGLVYHATPAYENVEKQKAAEVRKSYLTRLLDYKKMLADNNFVLSDKINTHMPSMSDFMSKIFKWKV